MTMGRGMEVRERKKPKELPNELHMRREEVWKKGPRHNLDTKHKE